MLKTIRFAWIFLAILMLGILVSSFTGIEKPVITVTGNYYSVTAEKAYNLFRSAGTKGVTIIDVRTPEEFSAGHISAAKNINFYSYSFDDDISRLNRNNTYLVYCRTGNRSIKAIRTFKSLGFTRIFNLLGGLCAWKSSGYPIEY